MLSGTCLLPRPGWRPSTDARCACASNSGRPRRCGSRRGRGATRLLRLVYRLVCRLVYRHLFPLGYRRCERAVPESVSRSARRRTAISEPGSEFRRLDASHFLCQQLQRLLQRKHVRLPAANQNQRRKEIGKRSAVRLLKAEPAGDDRARRAFSGTRWTPCIRGRDARKKKSPCRKMDAVLPCRGQIEPGLAVGNQTEPGVGSRSVRLAEPHCVFT